MWDISQSNMMVDEASLGNVAHQAECGAPTEKFIVIPDRQPKH